MSLCTNTAKLQYCILLSEMFALFLAATHQCSTVPCPRLCRGTFFVVPDRCYLHSFIVNKLAFKTFSSRGHLLTSIVSELRAPPSRILRQRSLANELLCYAYVFLLVPALTLDKIETCCATHRIKVIQIVLGKNTYKKNLIWVFLWRCYYCNEWAKRCCRRAVILSLLE